MGSSNTVSPLAAVAPVLMVCTWMLDVPHGSPLVPVADEYVFNKQMLESFRNMTNN
jgi:hypothetical protein